MIKQLTHTAGKQKVGFLTQKRLILEDKLLSTVLDNIGLKIMKEWEQMQYIFVVTAHLYQSIHKRRENQEI